MSYQLAIYLLLSCCSAIAAQDHRGIIVEACDTRYRLISVLGKGTFGTVYRAIQARTGTTVAIKVFETKTELYKYLYQQEVNAMAQLKGVPHTVQMICSKTRPRDATSLIVLEFCNEGDLESKIESISQEEGLRLWDQMATGLQGMHEAGIIHQDIKPDNLFLHNGQLKIGDFGLAITKEQAQKSSKMLSGTPTYIAPERFFRSTQPYTEKVDLWSTGITFYRVFAKQHPFITQRGSIKGYQLLWNLYRFPRMKKSVLSRMDSRVSPILYGLLHKTPSSRRIIRSNEVNYRNNQIPGRRFGKFW